LLCKSRLKNLRECHRVSVIHILKFKAASVLRTDLLELATWRIQSYTNSGREDVPDWKELFGFLSCLLHSRVPSFQLPTGFIWSGNFMHEYTPLLETIGAECGNLVVLKGKTCYNSALDLTKDYMTMWHGPAIFRLVSQLTMSLQVVLMETYTCDNWSLQQFAKHAPNLRQVFYFQYLP
jgi:hypothetical protein